MFRFVNWPQVMVWHNSTRPSGPVCVLKQVERRLGLIYEIKPSGQRKLAGPLELDERRNK